MQFVASFLYVYLTLHPTILSDFTEHPDMRRCEAPKYGAFWTRYVIELCEALKGKGLCEDPMLAFFFHSSLTVTQILGFREFGV